MPEQSFFAELRKRKVLQAAAIYGAVAFGVTEIVVTVVDRILPPQLAWVSTLAVIVFVVGFPVAMFLSWTFDISSEGIQRTEVSSRRGKASIALSMVLLVAGTAGLFLLIKPSIEGTRSQPDILPNSVAVLPFENASQDADDAYLSEGLSDELRDQLGRVTELRLAARSSSIAALERGMDAVEASDNLRVAHILEGSLRRQGNRLRVSVQLIEGHTGLAIWSETYQRSASELLVVQQSIADEIVSRILPKAEDVVTTPATRDADANELMLLARYYERQVRERQVRDDETLLDAIRLYREATEADPESALAHSRLAGALLFLGDIDAAEAPIRTALILDAQLSEVQNTLGEFHWARGDPESAAAFRRAVELNPHNADALHNYANYLWLSTAPLHYGDPVELFRRALENDLANLSRHAAFGDYLGQHGRIDEVRQIIRNIQSRFDTAESYRAVGLLYEVIGEVDTAIVWTLRARNLEPNNPDHIEKLAALYALIGDAETALKLESPPSLNTLLQLGRYDELIDYASELMFDEPNDIGVRYMLGFAYLATDAFEPAIHILTSAGVAISMDAQVRSVSDIEASFTLRDAMVGTGLPELVEAARAMAVKGENEAPWSGDVGWAGTFRGCNYAILGRHDKALETLLRVKESRRLRYYPILRDARCFREYTDEPVYQDVLKDQEDRRTRIREKLPTTLAEFGVEL
jgi:TolB-like protein/Tfp pilus assembly protein PilF